MEALKELIIAKMDELQFLDMLGLDISDLVETFEEQIEEQREQFENAVGS